MKFHLIDDVLEEAPDRIVAVKQVSLAEEYLADPSLAVAISVSHYRPQGEPWGRYVVMLVVADPKVWGT